jgi:hypothetical protein
MRPDVRYAVAARDDGLRKVGKFTWRAAGAAAVCSALIALAFGHHNRPAPTGSASRGSIQVPSQPPGPGQGGGQVTSGAS